MQITARTTFLDGYDRFEEGQTYEVDPKRGGQFVSHFLATSPDVDQSWLGVSAAGAAGAAGAVGTAGATATTLPGPVTIHPDDIVHEHATEVL